MDQPNPPVLQRRLQQKNGPSIAQMLTMAIGAAIALGAVGVGVAASVPSIDLFGLYAARDRVAAADAEKEQAEAKAETRPATPAPPAPEPAPRVDHSAGFSELNPEKQPVAETPAEPEAKPTEEDGEPAPPPMPGFERTPDRDAAMLREMPKAVDLPKINDVGESTLSYLHEASHIKYEDLAILGELASLAEGERFHVERVPLKNRWLVHLARAGQDETAGVIVAEIWTKPASIMFRWRPEAQQNLAAEQLRNTKLQITAGNHQQQLALRKPLMQKDAMLDLTSRKMEIECPVAFPPKAETIYFELLGVEQFPINASYVGEKRHVAVPKATVASDNAQEAKDAKPGKPSAPKPAAKPMAKAPLQVKPFSQAKEVDPKDQSEAAETNAPDAIAPDAKSPDAKPVESKPAANKPAVAKPATPKPTAPKSTKPAASAAPSENGDAGVNAEPADASKIVVVFDKFQTGELPQLWVEPRYQSDPSKVVFSVTGVLMRGKIRDDLTPKALELYRVPRERTLASVERDRNNMHDEAVLIDRRIGELKADPGTSAAAIVKSRAEIKRMQTRLPIVQKEFKKLDEQLQRLKAELNWVGAADRLLQVINKAVVIQYRVYAKSGDLEIDLVKSAPN